MRYQWIHVRLDALDRAEMTELVTDAWVMCVPRKVRREWFGEGGGGGAERGWWG